MSIEQIIRDSKRPILIRGTKTIRNHNHESYKHLKQVLLHQAAQGKCSLKKNGTIVGPKYTMISV